ncbi:MAG: hypothetical protein N3B13_09795 [Deltaproteobacteria bacterium]|nr:hypothetical protein [Deltaproteobacteria bacterium]
MRRLYLTLLLIIPSLLFADDMSFTFRYPEDKSGIFTGLMPKNLPDEKGYNGSQTTITPLFAGGRVVYRDFSFQLVLPLVINPDRTKDDIMLNTLLIDAGYVFRYGDSKILSGIQFTPGLNAGANPQNELRNNVSFYSCFYGRIIGNFSIGINLQYYQSLSDKIKYSGLYITRANSGFSSEIRAEYLFGAENLSVVSDILLFRDTSNGISNIYLNPGVRFLADENNTVYVTLSIPLYDDNFTTRYGSGINLYYDKRF